MQTLQAMDVWHKDRVSRIFTPSHTLLRRFFTLDEKIRYQGPCLLACLPCVYVCTVVSFGERDKSITLGKCESNYIWYYILSNIWIAVSWFRLPTHIALILLGKKPKKLRFCNKVVQSRGGTRKAICMYVCTLTPSTLNFFIKLYTGILLYTNLVNKVRWHMEIRGFKNENSVKLYLKTLLLQNKKGVGWSLYIVILLRHA